jgi:hypothetical protein
LRGYEVEVTMRRAVELLLSMGLCATIATAGCMPASGPNPAATVASSGPIPPDWPPLPDGVGCTSDLVQFQTILTSDVETGFINRPVYDEVETALKTAAQACAEGRDAQARKLVQATKKRYGYRS